MTIKIFAFLLIAALSSCTYKFSGASTEGLKTVIVRTFENNAPLVVPNLNNQLTEALKTRIRNQTNLSVSTTEADAIFEGRITGYDIKPVALQSSSTPTAGANRLTVTVSVKYVNNVAGKEKESFEESFTKFFDFPLNGASIQAALPNALDQINKQLTEDIFNRAFAQW
ncbi:LptE family protein [Pedobacter sp. MC2016-05]|uniref:LptE family protein n=1 Tax=Pedobacter sp. MC2016-05 TaxID=2994474 RepID=UPI002247B287|nr:LptE family protein [Pedobacter sp. MC2016-05]MCX2473014.1 LptE family protein [Pedobacter sp. MC2016-05]